jgi:hypothetical protein
MYIRIRNLIAHSFRSNNKRIKQPIFILILLSLKINYIVRLKLMGYHHLINIYIINNYNKYIKKTLIFTYL